MEENNVNETPVENEVVDNTANNIAEVESLKAEIEEANDRYKRLFAEFENYKKEHKKIEKIFMVWLQVMLFQQCFQ